MRAPFIALALLTACATAPPKKEPRPHAAAEEPQPDFAPVSRPSETVLLTGGTLLTAVGPPVKGNLLIRDGRIAAISEGPLDPPPGAQVIDVTGRFVAPGIIDSHSHIGVFPAPGDPSLADGNEMTGPAQPDVRAEHGFWPQDPQIERAVVGGVTAVQVLPGSGNLIGGRSTTVKLHPGISARAMRFPGAPWGLKMACGENPRRVYGQRTQKPSTRMGNMALFRERFQKAREYRDTWRRAQEAERDWRRSGQGEDKRPAPPSRDLGLETLAAALDGRILVHVHCYRADEMIQMLELADEMGFHVRSFHHAVEAYKIRDVLAAHQTSVSTWADWWGFKLEANDAIPQGAGLLAEAGARAIIHSDSATGLQRLNQEAAKALYAARQAGIEVSDEEALRWITLHPAWALGIDAQTGSLEVGKMADVVVWSAHPFSVYARADLVWIDGVREWDAARKAPPWSDFDLGALPGVEEGLR
ncbi:MAG: amidohydrolase [Myxococcales bacterium]